MRTSASSTDPRSCATSGLRDRQYHLDRELGRDLLLAIFRRILNSAGLVSFEPSLDSAIRINSLGAKNVLDLARKLGAKLVSICYVAGPREGRSRATTCGRRARDRLLPAQLGDLARLGGDNELWDRDFDPAAEIADCLKLIEQA